MKPEDFILYSAAPELLEALKATGFADIECDNTPHCGTEWGVCAPCMARAAIKKATQE